MSKKNPKNIQGAPINKGAPTNQSGLPPLQQQITDLCGTLVTVMEFLAQAHSRLNAIESFLTAHKNNPDSTGYDNLNNSAASFIQPNTERTEEQLTPGKYTFPSEEMQQVRHAIIGDPHHEMMRPDKPIDKRQDENSTNLLTPDIKIDE